MQHEKNRTSIVAEIGTGHEGDISHAYRLIDAAADAGADFVKFQMVYADEILHVNTGIVNLPGGAISLYDRFRDMEVPLSFYEKIVNYCQQRKIGFFCTPFGLRSAKELRLLHPAYIKIASPELNHFPLITEVASYGIPLILSSGVSQLSDIEKALDTARNAPERILLHCVTNYPAPEEDYNLNVLPNLAGIFGIQVGVSDHSLDPVLIPVLAVSCGACMIEKHITLSREGNGLDDPVALTPELFTQMVIAVRGAENKSKANIVSELSHIYGTQRVQAILGDGVKRLAESEKTHYYRTNRSIHYLRSMQKGESIRERDIALLRTEKNLSPGLSPEFLDTVKGAILVRDVESGAGVVWADIIQHTE